MGDDDRDAFSVLGLKDTASTSEVKEIYRDLAKKLHPDVNPDNPAAAEHFKRITSAYTQALLISAKREREGPSVSREPWGSSSARGPRAARTAYASPRAASGPVDGQRFNVREWESAHYGLKGATAEERQSQYIRQLYRQQRGQQQQRAARGGWASSAAAGSRARGGQRMSGSSSNAVMITMSIAACASVWTAVYETNFGRYRRR